MRARQKWVVLLAAVLAAASGCWHSQMVKRMMGVSAGPYTVKVLDASTGRGIGGAVVEWDYYFSSSQVDPSRRPNWGLSDTDWEGIARIPAVEHPSGDAFQELNVVVTVAGYLGGKRTVRQSSGTITFNLAPITPLGR
jgi:hypothetical protein